MQPLAHCCQGWRDHQLPGVYLQQGLAAAARLACQQQLQRAWLLAAVAAVRLSLLLSVLLLLGSLVCVVWCVVTVCTSMPLVTLSCMLHWGEDWRGGWASRR
jgi:hypothetical protein